MKTFWQRLIADECGQDLAEYGIALAVISIGIVVAAGAIATDVADMWTTAQGEIATVVAGN
jgi:Flp pilus assembly pilin Flp